MPSRMERYYQTNVDISKRTRKNQHLYDDIHTNLDYEDVKQIPNANEISPAKLNELLRNEKKVERRVIKNEDLNLNIDEQEDEHNYDIKEALEKAKNDNVDKNDYHKIKEEQLNLLKKIQSYKISQKESNENLDELLNTIASTKLLKELNDRDLSLNLLDDLKSNDDDTIVGGIDSIDRVLNDVPKFKQDIEEKNEIDKSFYTSSMSFSPDDFDELQEIKSKLHKNNLLVKILAIILSIVVLIIIILVLVLL